jgi:voltage-gated potassium channel
MKDHVIICGYGYNGKKVAEELQRQGIEHIIIEREKEIVNRLYEGKKVKYVGVVEGAKGRIIMGNAKTEEVLKNADVDKAKALLVTVGSDVEAAFITLMARTLNPSLTIVVKVNKLESMRKIYQAGATKVVSPSVIGGKLAAKAAVRPLVAEFIDRVTFMKDFEIAQIKVDKASHFKNKRIRDLKLSERGVSILAIFKSGALMANPPADTVLEEEDVMAVLGPSKELREMAYA